MLRCTVKLEESIKYDNVIYDLLKKHYLTSQVFINTKNSYLSTPIYIT